MTLWWRSRCFRTINVKLRALGGCWLSSYDRCIVNRTDWKASFSRDRRTWTENGSMNDGISSIVYVTVIFSFWLDQYYSRVSIIIFTLDWRYVTIILKSLWNSVWIFIYSIFLYIQICISRVSVIKKLSEIRDREIASRILTIRSTRGLASEYILINIHRSASKFPNLRTDGLLNISCVITRENMNWNYSITALKNSPL